MIQSGLWLADASELIRVIERPDRFAEMLEVRVVAIHEHLGDHRSHFALDSLAVKQLVSQPLDHVAHAALAIRVASVERQARNAPLALLNANQNVADLRSASVGDDDP